MIERIYYTRAETLKYLNVSNSTLIRWVKEGYIKEYRVSKSSHKPLYNLKEIEEKIKKFKGIRDVYASNHSKRQYKVL